MRHGPGEVGVSENPAQVPDVGPGCARPRQGLEAADVTPPAGQGVDDGVHGLTVGVQGLAVRN